MDANTKLTLNDLIVDKESDKWTEAFGLSDERGREIAERMDEIYRNLDGGRGWSARGIYLQAAEEGLAETAGEVAFITYLIGCRVGEDAMARQVGSIQDMLSQLPGSPVSDKNGEEEDEYVN